MPQTSPALRHRAGIAIGGFVVVGQVIWLCALRGRRILDHYNTLIIGQIALAVALLILACLLRCTGRSARRASTQRDRWIIIAVTAFLQLAGLLLPGPGLSGDVARYRLDARMWLSGVSPYATSPAKFLQLEEDLSADPLRPDPRFPADAPSRALPKNVDRLDLTVSYPTLHTIYPPASQAVFIIARMLEDAFAPVDRSPPAGASLDWRQHIAGEPWIRQAGAFRMIFSAFAVGCAFALTGILIHAGKSPWWAMLLVWNPLFTIEISAMAHQDVIGCFCLLMCLRASGRSRLVSTGIWLALACGCKPLAIVILPWLWLSAASSARRNLLIAFIAAALLLFIPVLAFQNGYLGWLHTGKMFSTGWAANGSFYQLFDSLARHHGGQPVKWIEHAGRLLGLVLVLLASLVLYRRRATPESAGYCLFLLMLLVAPVVYPWYLLWALALVPLRCGNAGWSALVWSGTSSISYLLLKHFDAGSAWKLTLPELLSEYAPVYAAVLIESILLFRRLALPGVR